MTDPQAKALADKYIGRTGGAPEPFARLRRPARVGGAFLEPKELRHVVTIYATLEEFGASSKKMAHRSTEARRSLAALLGASEEALRIAVELYLKQERS